MADVRDDQGISLRRPRRRRPSAAGMIFRAADAVNDLRPLSRRAPQESASLRASAARNLRRQAIDGAVRPYRYRSSLRSWDDRGKRRLLSGVSAFSKFFAAKKRYHDDPRARRRDPDNTATASPMRFLVVARTNLKPEFGLLLCIIALRHRVNRCHEFTPRRSMRPTTRLIGCADNDDRPRHDPSLPRCLRWR